MKEPTGAGREKDKKALMMIRRDGEERRGTAQSTRALRVRAASDTVSTKPASLGI